MTARRARFAAIEQALSVREWNTLILARLTHASGQQRPADAIPGSAGVAGTLVMSPPLLSFIAGTGVIANYFERFLTIVSVRAELRG